MPLKQPFQPIEWNDSMETGIASIDRQHHFLVDTLRMANQELLRGHKDGHEDALVHNIVNDLLSYAIMHFETEEELMQRNNYSAAHPEDAHAHIEQHRSFSRHVVEISDQLHEGQQVSCNEVLAFLNEWLRNHVLGTDRKLSAFLLQTKE
ncbi:MAG: bacteriohemerythrin [Gammaproteobacteria bacterium]|jgi:hemerythrin